MYVSGRKPDTRKQRPTPLSKVLHGLWSLKSVLTDLEFAIRKYSATDNIRHACSCAYYLVTALPYHVCVALPQRATPAVPARLDMSSHTRITLISLFCLASRLLIAGPQEYRKGVRGLSNIQFQSS